MPTTEARSINAQPAPKDAFRSFVRIVLFALRAEPWRVALLSAATLGRDITALATVAVVGNFVSGAAHGHVATAVVLRLLVVAAVSQGLGWSTFGLGEAVRERIAHAMEAHVLDLVASIPTIEHHERPDFYCELSLLRWQSIWVGSAAMRVVDMVSATTRVIGTTALLMSVHPALAAFAMFGVPAVWGSRAAQRVHEEAFEDVVEDRRARDLFVEAATSASAAKEVRVFGLRHEIGRRNEELTRAVDARLERAQVRSTLIDVGVQAVSGVAVAGAILTVALLALHRAASVGDVVLTIGLASQLTGHLGAAGASVGPLREASIAAHRLSWLEREVARTLAATGRGKAPSRLEHGIALRHVGFAYPGSDRPVLHDVNLDLPAGATVALIGENGAGKTTLVKLLTGMYPPTTGTIEVDGVDLTTIDPAKWRRAISGAFQDHARLELLLRESVGVAEPASITNDDRLTETLNRATAEDLPAHLPSGLDTQLGRLFRGGVGLSVGQWQKVALARGLVRRAPVLLVLDEPTSALDAVAEQALFASFARAADDAASATGGITLLISHRFSTVRTADLVIVLVDGRITEVGTHAELMASATTYRELYELQANAYR